MYRLATCRHPIYHCDMADRFGALASLTIGEAAYRIFRLSALADQGSTDLDRLPFSIRVLLESLLRLHDGKAITEQHVLDAEEAQHGPTDDAGKWTVAAEPGQGRVGGAVGHAGWWFGSSFGVGRRAP